MTRMDMIERVARAIWDAEFDKAITNPWDKQNQLQKQFYRMLASAAIRAMQEPQAAE